MDPYKVFNKTSKEFIKDLIKSYPDVKNLKLIYLAFKVCKKMSKKAPCKFFDTIIQPYKTQILNKDDSFINREDFNVIFLSNIKNVVKNISEENKEHIWTYLHLLIKLMEQCDTKNINVSDFESVESTDDIESDED